ncbi:MAG: helicase-related protein, partial [Polyangiaceae bacterium]
MHPESRLPIDELLEPLVEALRSHRAVVLEAPPGAGKTTRVPRALLQAGFARGGEIWVTEPRRVAARLAASFVARELGSELGGRVGYTVRFEERASNLTELRFVTEGVLLRRLLGRSTGRPLGAVVLDEFHERHVDTDLNLMLLRRELERDPELRLVVMSATLEAESVARYLGGCPRLRSLGRAFPLTLRHALEPDERALELRVASAVKQLVRESEQGDVLVFLPGAREIRNAEGSLQSFAEQQQLRLVPLHGELPLEAQARALGRADRRKIVLSTNVAESSITVEGVTAVVDSGLARIAEHSPWTGRQSLEIRPIAQASAIQRAGRAGRTQPGQVVRLYTEANYAARPSREKPEIQRLDLAEPLLMLYGAGLVPAADSWLDAPSDTVVEGAQALLERLGLVDGQRPSELGRRALDLPLHPRLARIVLEGERLGNVDVATLAAALLSERDIRERAGMVGRDSELIGCECDVDQLIEMFKLAESERFSAASLRRLGLHAGRVATVRSAEQQIRRELRRGSRGQRDRSPEHDPYDAPSQRQLSLALLAGFPDRVARRRQAGGRDLILSTGHVASLADESVVKNAQLLLAVDAEDTAHAPFQPGRPGARTKPGIRVRLASPLEPEWLLDHAAAGLTEKEELLWDETRERACINSQLCWGAVVLEQSQRPALPGPQTAAIVERNALLQQANLFGKGDVLGELMARAELMARLLPESSFASLHALGTRGLLGRACQNVSSLDELRALDWKEVFLGELSARERSELERETPEWVQLRAGRRVRVHYAEGQPPFIASRLQDFFGM